MAKNSEASVTFATVPAHIEMYDRAAEKEMLTRSAWIRRVLAQAASARGRESEIVA